MEQLASNQDEHASTLFSGKASPSFQGTHITGIKYDLLDEGILKEEAEPAQPQKSARPHWKPLREDAVRQKPSSQKVVHCTRPEPRDEADEESEAIREIKNQVRRATEVLEQGNRSRHSIF